MGAEDRCGCACSRRARASSSEVGDVLTRDSSSRCDPGHGDRQPVGTVVQLVLELVDRLLELEDREQVGDRRLARGQQHGIDWEKYVLEEELAGALLELGRGRDAAHDLDRRGRRRRRSAASATSRSGERFWRRSNRGRAGSPSKSMISQPSRGDTWSVWPEMEVAVGSDRRPPRRAGRGWRSFRARPDRARRCGHPLVVGQPRRRFARCPRRSSRSAATATRCWAPRGEGRIAGVGGQRVVQLAR